MLTWFRHNAKIFLIATIVIFIALIFLRWGMGMSSGQPRNPYQRPIGMVNEKKIMPENYQQAIQTMSERYRNILENSNNPDPEAMLMIMSQELSEQAFQNLVNGELQNEYLKKHHWDPFTLNEAEELLVAQIGMQDLGDMDARDYLDRIKSDQPGAYQQYLYQTYVNANSMIFPMASRMDNMTSLDEVRYLKNQSQAQITARYVEVDATPPQLTSDELENFYNDNIALFSRPAGSLIRYITVQISPTDEDYQTALQTLDSLSYASQGNKVASTRNQLTAVFGDSLELSLGARTEPIHGMYTGNPSIESFHVFLLDSVHQFRDTLTGTLGDPMRDTLFLRNWEVPVFPGYNTIRSLSWDLESSMEQMLASTVPDIPDTITVVDFGEMSVTENSQVTGSITDEMVTYATDTIWSDSLGPIFFNQSYLGGYPAFTMVKRLQFFDADTMSVQQAMDTGTLEQVAQFQLARRNAMEIAQGMMDNIQSSGMNLAEFAQAESLEVYTTPVFTASQIKNNSQGDPEAIGGIMSSKDFGMAALVAPEFKVIGPFVAGSGCVIAEILSRQLPPEDQNTDAIVYLSAQYMHEQLSSGYLMDNLTQAADIRDMREEWTDYYESVEDSIRATQEEAAN